MVLFIILFGSEISAFLLEDENVGQMLFTLLHNVSFPVQSRSEISKPKHVYDVLGQTVHMLNCVNLLQLGSCVVLLRFYC